MTADFRIDRRGVALPLTLIALSAAALLAAAGLMLARLESRSSDLTLAALEASAAAESGVSQTLGSWLLGRWDTLGAGSIAGGGMVALGPRQLHTDSVLHLGGLIFLARSVGESRDAGGQLLARSELGRWLRVDRPRFPGAAAVLARGPVELSGGMALNGSDQVPPAWTGQCPPPAPPDAALRDSTALPSFGAGCAGGACLSGTPGALIDTTLSDSMLSGYGPWTFGSLDAAATRRLGGIVSGAGPVLDSTGACDGLVATNLGEPLDSTSSCFQVFPIIAAAPGTRFEAGRGQGVLLGEGDLELGDGFDFYGVVIVRGRLSMPGTGSRVTGVALLRHPVTDTVRLTGSSAISRSSCAVRRAADRSTPWKPLTSRSWVRY